MTGPDSPIVSNPQPKAETRPLRQRLEELSEPESTARLVSLRAVLLREGFSAAELETLLDAVDLSMAVHTLMTGEREAESHKGLADEMTIILKADRPGMVRAVANRFGNDAVVIHPHQELVIRPERGQVAVLLRRVRPRDASREPLPPGLHRGTVKEMVYGGDDARSGTTPDPQDGPVAPPAGPAANDAVVVDGPKPGAGGVGGEGEGGDVRPGTDGGEHPGART